MRRVGPASLAVVIPKDWCRGNEIESGDRVLVRYNGSIRIEPLPKDGRIVAEAERDG